METEDSGNMARSRETKLSTYLTQLDLGFLRDVYMGLSSKQILSSDLELTIGYG